MKCVILCGGLGTRLREETEFRPKPMVEIGGRPILWHIMKCYARFGHTDFVLCLGYKGDIIRDYFLNYERRNRDVTVTLGSQDIQIHNCHEEAGWRVTLAETGDKTLTGGRLRRIAPYLEDGPFLATYGDGVSDVDIKALLAFHRAQGRLGTVTAVRPSSRFGELSIKGGLLKSFDEKPQVHTGFINGGFFVFEKAVFDMMGEDDESLETTLLTRLTQKGQLSVFEHTGFWQCMDTFREMEILNDLWRTNRAPWARWKA